MKLLIGCPVSHRAWPLAAWFDAVEDSVGVLRQWSTKPLDHEYVFLGDEKTDQETYETIRELCPNAHWVQVHDPRGADVRDWGPKRYARMAELRNLLLAEVRRQAPDAFLSLDSDILLHEDALTAMAKKLEPDTAVSSKVFLSKYGKDAPNWANLGREGSLRRSDSHGTFRVDVIMAIKLMSAGAYTVDYQYDIQGEDIGWSKAARGVGVKLIWTGEVASKHLFSQDCLGKVDDRIGW